MTNGLVVFDGCMTAQTCNAYATLRSIVKRSVVNIKAYGGCNPVLIQDRLVSRSDFVDQ